MRVFARVGPRKCQRVEYNLLDRAAASPARDYVPQFVDRHHAQPSQRDDAGQGRKDFGHGTARIFQGVEGHQFTAGVADQDPHQLQPGIPGGTDDRDFDLFHDE